MSDFGHHQIAEYLVLSSLTSDLGKSQGSLKFGCFSIWSSLFIKLTAAHHSCNAFLLHATYTTASSLAILLKNMVCVCVCVYHAYARVQMCVPPRTTFGSQFFYHVAPQE